MRRVHRAATVPGTNDGSFAPAVHAPPAVRLASTLSASDPINPEAVETAISAVRNEFGWVDLSAELFNHSTASDADTLTLADMAEPDLARMNCDAATSALLAEWGDGQPISVHFTAPSTGPTPGTGSCAEVQHAAMLVERDGHEIVVDVTARQFDPDAEFPVVVPREAWEAQVASWHRNLGYVPADTTSLSRTGYDHRYPPTTPRGPAARDAVEVRDSSGDPVEVTPGVIDDNAEWVYKHGQCLALAVALSEETGWPVHLRTFTDGDGYEPGGPDGTDDVPIRYTNLRHAYLQAPDGTLLDIAGEHDPVIVDEDARDFDGDAYVPARIVPADQARALLDEFEGYLEHQDLDVARTFTRSVLALREDAS